MKKAASVEKLKAECNLIIEALRKEINCDSILFFGPKLSKAPIALHFMQHHDREDDEGIHINTEDFLSTWHTDSFENLLEHLRGMEAGVRIYKQMFNIDADNICSQLGVDIDLKWNDTPEDLADYVEAGTEIEKLQVQPQVSFATKWTCIVELRRGLHVVHSTAHRCEAEAIAHGNSQMESHGDNALCFHVRPPLVSLEFK